MTRALVFSALLLIILAALSQEPAGAYMTSKFLGGFPGLCEDSRCFDDGQPLADPPPDVGRVILQHQLTSPTCPTDLIYIFLEYPSNTGSEALDKAVARTMDDVFDRDQKQALNLACNDFEGCRGNCLPIGFEIKHYIQRPGPGYISFFRVDRFIGNFRPDRHAKGTVEYKFENYSLKTGQKLRPKDVFENPGKAAPLFWKKVAELVSNQGQNGCSLKNYRVSQRAISNGRLETGDFILTRGGATVALIGTAPGTCVSKALDLSIQDMLDIGAFRAIWGL
ncbi:MAG: hypothetical protein LBP95_01390 [Deltaproteobacteria bacterium]|jgi:hypothetical protein|nr:hypothetical protein [Deltaproteobacteria bacterium]